MSHFGRLLILWALFASFALAEEAGFALRVGAGGDLAATLDLMSGTVKPHLFGALGFSLRELFLDVGPVTNGSLFVRGGAELPIVVEGGNQGVFVEEKRQVFLRFGMEGRTNWPHFSFLMGLGFGKPVPLWISLLWPQGDGPVLGIEFLWRLEVR